MCIRNSRAEMKYELRDCDSSDARDVRHGKMNRNGVRGLFFERAAVTAGATCGKTTDMILRIIGLCNRRDRPWLMVVTELEETQRS